MLGTPGVYNEARSSRHSFTAHFVYQGIGACIIIQCELQALGILLCFVNADMLATIELRNTNMDGQQQIWIFWIV